MAAQSALGGGIPLACQDWAATKAAYRFFANDRVGEGEILCGHFRSTRDRADGVGGPVMVLHDTTEFSYRRRRPERVGQTCRVNSGKDKQGRYRFSRTFGAGRAKARAAIPLKRKELRGRFLACCRSAIGAVHEIGRGEAPQGLTLIPPGVNCTESAGEPHKGPYTAHEPFSLVARPTLCISSTKRGSARKSSQTGDRRYIISAERSS